MWRAIASNFLTLAIVFMIAAAGAVAWAKREYAGPGPLTQAICLKVPRGATIGRVSEALRAEGAIRSGYVFRVGADYGGKSGALKFGSYLIPPGASMAEIVDALTRGGQSTCGAEINYRIGVLTAELVLRELDPAAQAFVERAKHDPATGPLPEPLATALADADVRLRVTLVEGATSWQVAEALKRADFLAGEVAAVPPEGMLAPDSYEIERGADRGALLAAMQERQAAALAEAWAGRAEGLPYRTPEEALVMASLVEKETGVPGERARVASVFVNRLAQGIRLQTDPAVIYGLTKGQGSLGRGLRQSELRKRTPYNTYVIDGLPPGPIANPGREAILAALHPEPTRYLYFVADGSGGHAFAESLDEHNRNVERWRAIEAGRAASGQGEGSAGN